MLELSQIFTHALFTHCTFLTLLLSFFLLISPPYCVHAQVNHFGHYLLTGLLVDQLKAGAPSRVVQV